MQRGRASAAVEKIEQASSAKIFSGTARRQGLRFAEECAAESHAAEPKTRISSYLPRRPLPRYGGGGRGGGRCACGYLGSVSVRSTDDAFASFVSSTASDRKGFVKGEPVPLDRILVPFVRTKGTPRRRAVQIMPLQKAARRRRRSQTGPRRIGEIKPSHSLCRQPLSQPCG